MTVCELVIVYRYEFHSHAAAKKQFLHFNPCSSVLCLFSCLSDSICASRIFKSCTENDSSNYAIGWYCRPNLRFLKAVNIYEDMVEGNLIRGRKVVDLPRSKCCCRRRSCSFRRSSRRG
jgi:hypothetical protein